MACGRSIVAAVENRMAGMLDPGIVIFGVEVLRRRADVSAGVLVLGCEGQPVPVPVIVDLRIADAIGRERPARAAENVMRAWNRAIAADNRLRVAVDRTVGSARV